MPSRKFIWCSSHILSAHSICDQPLTTSTLCAHFPQLDRCTVMQHIKVLEKAALVIVERNGRERWNHLNPLPIHDIYIRWIGPHAAGAVTILERLKSGLEKQGSSAGSTPQVQKDPIS